jgi:hypothetical protein
VREFVYFSSAVVGKPPMQAVGVCRRMLVMLSYVVLKSRTPFDPRWSSRTPA